MRAKPKAKHPGIRALEAAVRWALQRSTLARSNARLVVAVSGGPDSMALLHTLLAIPEGPALHVAHVNHDFRGQEADEDARFVAAAARGLGLPSTVEDADSLEYQRVHRISSFEEAARGVRYGFLCRVARDTGADAIALGHTADDQAETILMHILRGTGLEGLRGMEELSMWRSPQGRGPEGPVEGLLLRPLLKVSRGSTRKYCLGRDITFRDDTTNLLPRFTRNRLRNELLPLMEAYNPRVRDSLARLGALALQTQDYLGMEVDRIWPTAATPEGDALDLDLRELKALHPLLKGLVLRRAYRELAGDLRRLGQRHVQAMIDLIDTPSHGSRVDLPRGLSLRSQGQKLMMGPGPSEEVPCPHLTGEHPVNVPGVTRLPGWVVMAKEVPRPQSLKTQDPFTAFLDLDRLGQGLVARGRRRGDRFQPLGLPAEKKLQDFLVDQKVPRAQRNGIPLLVSSQGIMWVVGYRPSERARVTEGTKRVARIRWEREES